MNELDKEFIDKFDFADCSAVDENNILPYLHERDVQVRRKALEEVKEELLDAERHHEMCDTPHCVNTINILGNFINKLLEQ